MFKSSFHVCKQIICNHLSSRAVILGSRLLTKLHIKGTESETEVRKALGIRKNRGNRSCGRNNRSYGSEIQEDLEGQTHLRTSCSTIHMQLYVLLFLLNKKNINKLLMNVHILT